MIKILIKYQIIPAIILIMLISKIPLNITSFYKNSKSFTINDQQFSQEISLYLKTFLVKNYVNLLNIC